MTDKVSVYLLIYFKVLFMFTHAIQNNDIVTFINNLNKVALTNVTVWNYTIIRIFLQQKLILQCVLIPTESHFVYYLQHISEDLKVQQLN